MTAAGAALTGWRGPLKSVVMAISAKKLAMLSALALVAVLVGTGQAAPEPAKAPKSWQIDFEFHDLQRMTLTLPGDRHPTVFWYLLYTATNNSGKDVDFFPSFELVTDSLGVLTAGDNISPSVYDAVRGRHKKAYPFFRDPIRASGKLLQGPDNARTSAAVFRDFDPEADAFRIYAAGLSGEIARISNSTFDGDTPQSAGNPRFFTLRKTLEITYHFPGDTNTRHLAAPVRQSQNWVMR